MIKRKELSNPDSCMSCAKDDEMTFVLLARDAAAPAAIRHWVKERIFMGKNKYEDSQIQEAIKCAEEMDRQRKGSVPAQLDPAAKSENRGGENADRKGP